MCFSYFFDFNHWQCAVFRDLLLIGFVDSLCRCLFHVQYRDTSSEVCFLREGIIRRAVQTMFEKQRGNLPTRWEYAVSDILRQLLSMIIFHVSFLFNIVFH